MKKILLNLSVISFIPIFFISCNTNNYKKAIFEYLENSLEIKIMKNNDILGYATGFLYDNKILTNKHILLDEFSEYFYRKHNENEWIKTTLIKSSPTHDLALFSFRGKTNFKKRFLDANIGDKVYFVGNPQGYGLGVGEGIVSTFNELTEKNYVNEYIRIGGSIDKGNSGGPIFNENGDLIGMSTFKIWNLENGERINSFFYAIPAKDIKSFLDNDK